MRRNADFCWVCIINYQTTKLDFHSRNQASISDQTYNLFIQVRSVLPPSFYFSIPTFAIENIWCIKACSSESTANVFKQLTSKSNLHTYQLTILKNILPKCRIGSHGKPLHFRRTLEYAYRNIFRNQYIAEQIPTNVTEISNGMGIGM